MSRVIVVTPPAAIVSQEQMKAHLRVDFSDDDAVIDGCIAAATGYIDGPAGWLGRSLGSQVLEWRSDVFRCDMELPYGPVISVASVKYLDTDGVEQTADSALYSVIGDRVVLKAGSAWPSISQEPESVRIRYTAGYAAVPAPIISAVKLMAADLYHNRESAAASTSAAVPMPVTAERLLRHFRVW